jgi:biopolymer transport protein ExbD
MAKRKKDRFGLGGEVHFQMAPLIDVVFLLLIFFITVTTFDKAEKVEVRLAYAKTAEKYQEGEDTLIVSVTDRGDILVQGKLFLTKRALQDYMQGLVNEFGANWKVAIRADRNARSKEVNNVYRAAANVGLTRISLITETREQEVAARQAEPGAAGGEKKKPEDEVIYGEE